MQWNTLGFGEEGITGPEMYVEHWKDGKWQEGGLQPFGSLPFDPRSAVLNYGVGAFEGLKAQRASDGRAVLFRPQENGKRLTEAANRLRMPEVPVLRFCRAVEQVAAKSAELIPPTGLGALYIRPLLFGSGYNMRLEPPKEFTFLAYAFPCGAYFGKSMRILADRPDLELPRPIRSAMGSIKAIGNYAGDYLWRGLAKEQGFDEVLYLDAKNGRMPEEVGAANVFFVMKDRKIITPSLRRPILPGITRMSVIALARDVDYDVREEDKPLAELLPNIVEMFCTGTAAGVAPVAALQFRKKLYEFQSAAEGSMTHRLRDALVGIQTGACPDTHGWLYEVKIR